MFKWVPGEGPPGLVEVPVWYVECPRRQISQLVLVLRESLPRDRVEMAHIRRIVPAPSNPGVARVLVCSQETVDRAIAARIVAEFDLELLEAVASRHAARSKAEAMEWSQQVWPVIWRGNPAAVVPRLSEAEEKEMSAEISNILAMPRGECSPITTVVMGKDRVTMATDSDPQNPLGHSIMRAIEEIANMIRSNPEDGRYLCTDAWVYARQDPCVMCSMALVHSRIARLILAELGGGAIERYKLHARKQLNHTFEVWAYDYEVCETTDADSNSTKS